MRLRMLIVSIMIIGTTVMYANKIEIDSGNFGNWVIAGEDGSVLKYNEINLLDSNLKTASVIDFIYDSYMKNKYAVFYVSFKKDILVDSIIIYNGFQFNSNIYSQNDRLKDIEVKIQNENDKSTKYSFTTNIQLIDETNMQKLILPDNTLIKNIVINVLSTYPGTKYDDICISEMEFWYKGEKYKVANLEQAKREYVKAYTQRASMKLYNGNIIKNLDEERYKNIIKITGWKYDPPEIRYISVLFESNGTIAAMWFYPKKYMVNGVNWGRDYPKRRIGYWKFDGYGRLLIKLGKGEWKVSKSSADYIEGKGYFIGTDLECGNLEPTGPTEKRGVYP